MPQTAMKRIRLLATDDSSEFLATLESFFETKPEFCLVGKARSGLEALALTQELRPDLVLMDLQMAGMNGLEATSEIRHRFPGVAVVIITGHEISGLRQICHKNGACDCVRKSRLNS